MPCTGAALRSELLLWSFAVGQWRWGDGPETFDAHHLTAGSHLLSVTVMLDLLLSVQKLNYSLRKRCDNHLIKINIFVAIVAVNGLQKFACFLCYMGNRNFWDNRATGRKLKYNRIFTDKSEYKEMIIIENNKLWSSVMSREATYSEPCASQPRSEWTVTSAKRLWFITAFRTNMTILSPVVVWLLGLEDLL